MWLGLGYGRWRFRRRLRARPDFLGHPREFGYLLDGADTHGDDLVIDRVDVGAVVGFKLRLAIAHGIPPPFTASRIGSNLIAAAYDADKIHACDNRHSDE